MRTPERRRRIDALAEWIFIYHGREVEHCLRWMLHCGYNGDQFLKSTVDWCYMIACDSVWSDGNAGDVRDFCQFGDDLQPVVEAACDHYKEVIL